MELAASVWLKTAIVIIPEDISAAFLCYLTKASVTLASNVSFLCPALSQTLVLMGLFTPLAPFGIWQQQNLTVT